MAVLVSNPPCVLHEDDHLLVVNKAAGLNTHSPSPYAGEGIYEWFKHREPRWADLAIVHRLDKGTSGVMVFAKNRAANKSLTEQFAGREVQKTYLLLTSKAPPQETFSVKGYIVRVGEKYFPKPTGSPSEFAETGFRLVGKQGAFFALEALPKTGRTHQIRVHAESKGLAIVGDEIYGGAPFQRLCLHAHKLRFKHPENGEEVEFAAEVDFEVDRARLLRELMIDRSGTDAYRVLNGAADGRSGWYVDRWGDYLLSQSERGLSREELSLMEVMARELGIRGVYHKILNKDVQSAKLEEAAPQPIFGEAAPENFEVKENGVRYEISFAQGYSVGLFLDQRDNRRRLITNHVGAGFDLFEGGLGGKEVLNTFAYTCGFSVCAALSGARTTSLDLSRKYLDWGRRNFSANGVDSSKHDFIYGDVFDWVGRFKKKGRVFDLILLDPPTFSHSKSGRPFQAEKDYGKLVHAVLPLLNPGGVLFSSTNAHRFAPEDFLKQIGLMVSQARRRIRQSHFVPQPIDFPIHQQEPAYLKTVWMRID